MKVRVTITLKAGVLDPQGKAIEGALKGLGFAGVEAARQGKIVDLVLAETDVAKAKAAAPAPAPAAPAAAPAPQAPAKSS